MNDLNSSLALLMMRLVFGFSMALGHGWEKLVNFSDLSTTFPDPIGAGSTTSLILAIFAEVLCAFLLAVGYFTRLACIPLLVTMAVAVILIHGLDPWNKMELAALYFTAYLVIFILGPGRFAMDSMKKSKRFS